MKDGWYLDYETMLLMNSSNSSQKSKARRPDWSSAAADRYTGRFTGALKINPGGYGISWLILLLRPRIISDIEGLTVFSLLQV